MQVNSAHPDSGIADLDNGSVKFMLHGRQNRGSVENDCAGCLVAAQPESL
jgi:hypothetical protein